tara:strand:- start:212 stop:652 length:441 start_codon:yes stop_codon:yes gene_type:complete
MIIRRAEPEDLPQLVELLTEMHNEVEIPVSKLSTEKGISVIKHVMKTGIVIVAESEGKIVGSQAGRKCCDWWSEEEHFSDFWFYVLPANRKSTAAIKLVKCFIKIGKELKLKTKLGHVYSGDIDRKDKFFNRLGFVKAGSLFVEAN